MVLSCLTRAKSLAAGLVVAIMITSAQSAMACTGIRLIAQDGSVAYGRTVEWGTFDLNSRVAIVPRGFAFTGHTPDGENGKKWSAKFGFVAIDALEKDIFADGMNEAGLAAGLFYHPGFAEYAKYDPAAASNSITAVDVVTYILSQFATVDEVREGMKDIRVVGVLEPSIGIPVPAHWMVTDPSGVSIVIEMTGGKVIIHDAPLGVITNSPTYDWHMINLRNYLNLSAVALPTMSVSQMSFSPLGGGSGMIGLPGDFTPPSRFVRAVAWTQTARPTPTANETVIEVFRILDNFNVPHGAAEGDGGEPAKRQGMRSGTIWTSAWNLKDKVLYYHTMHNRRVRKLQLGAIELSGDKIRHIPLDDEKEQDVKDITPGG